VPLHGPVSRGRSSGADARPRERPRRHPNVRLRRSRHPRKDTGAVLVEFAIVAPLLFLILFGIIDFSVVMFNDIAVRSGTSIGAREAAVMATNPAPPASSSCQTAGSFTGATQNLICYTKSHIGLNQARTRVSIWFATQNCSGACYAAGSPVVICTQYAASSTTGLFSAVLNQVTLSSKVEISIESSDSDPSLVPAQETPLTSTWPASCSTP
jgi:Flp pilus assembly protein TadG